MDWALVVGVVAFVFLAISWSAWVYQLGRRSVPTEGYFQAAGMVVPYESRSPRWPAIRKIQLIRHPACMGCGSRNELQVHHLKPFKTHPELELDYTNLVTVCVYCHFVIGHLNGWSRINPHALQDLTTHRACVLVAVAEERDVRLCPPGTQV